MRLPVFFWFYETQGQKNTGKLARSKIINSDEILIRIEALFIKNLSEDVIFKIEKEKGSRKRIQCGTIFFHLTTISIGEN